MNVNYHNFVKKMHITAKTEKIKCARQKFKQTTSLVCK